MKKLHALFAALIFFLTVSTMVGCTIEHSHSGDEWVTVRAATCTATGEEKCICSDCGEKFDTRTIPATGSHTAVTDAAVPPTDTEDGLTEGSHCSDCGTVIIAQQVIPALLQGTDIRSDILKIDGSAITATFDVDVETVNLFEGMILAKGAVAELFSDVAMTQRIEGGIVPLSHGMNSFYLRVINGKDTALFTVDIKRAASYTVELGVDGDSFITVEGGGVYSEGDSVTVTAAVTGAGYVFGGWYSGTELVSPDTVYTFTIEESVSLTARAEASPLLAPYIYTLSENFCVITAVKDRDAVELVIPEFVTDIDRGAFSGLDSLKSVTFAEGSVWYASKSPRRVEGTVVELSNPETAAILLRGSLEDHYLSVHNYTAETVSSTCTEDGYTVYTCFCGVSYTADVVPAAHNYTVKTVLPDCYTEGYNVYSCLCGATYTGDIVPATHIKTEKAVTPATYSSEGEETVSCKCGKVSETKTLPMLITPTPEGYIIYQDFELFDVGAYNNDTGGRFGVVEKDGVSYTVANPLEDSVNKALRFYRVAGDRDTNRDGYMNIEPRDTALPAVHVLEMSVMVTEKTTGVFYINARKATENLFPQFNSLLSYNAETGELRAGSSVITRFEKNVFYRISLVIDDASREYEVYINGYRMASGIKYANASYPAYTVGQHLLYRVSLNSSVSETEFYLDGISIYAPEGELNRPKNFAGNSVPVIENAKLPDINVFDAENATLQDIVGIAGEAMSNMNGYAVSGSPVSGKNRS